MQKTFLKFIIFELIERIARFRLLLNELADDLRDEAPALFATLQAEATALESSILEKRTTLNGLFNDQDSAAVKQALPSDLLDSLLKGSYQALCRLTRVLSAYHALQVSPETRLFLKDALPDDLLQKAGEQSVFLTAEGKSHLPLFGSYEGVLIDQLSVLQKNNPLGWLSLSDAYATHLLDSVSSFQTLRSELLKGDRHKSDGSSLQEVQLDTLLRHAIHLRLAGPAYYFHALSNAIFQQDDNFLQAMEPALFFGLNHQNLTHKSWVILHEACERSKSSKTRDGDLNASTLPEEFWGAIYRAVEKIIPAKFAFQEKNLDRSLQLQERLSQGILLSSTPHFSVEEVSDVLSETRQTPEFSIYQPLSMMTEYPQSPREIVNAGWLHKVERGPVWLYSVLNEDDNGGFDKLCEVLAAQDNLLCKSIETSEVHRVLLCTL